MPQWNPSVYPHQYRQMHRLADLTDTVQSLELGRGMCNYHVYKQRMNIRALLCNMGGILVTLKFDGAIRSNVQTDGVSKPQTSPPATHMDPSNDIALCLVRAHKDANNHNTQVLSSQILDDQESVARIQSADGSQKYPRCLLILQTWRKDEDR